MGVSIMKTKICTKCGKELELNADNFYRQTSNVDGYQNYCKPCRKEMDKERNKTKEHRESVNKRRRERYATDEKYRNKVNEERRKRKQTERYKIYNRMYDHNHRALRRQGKGLQSLELAQEILIEWFLNTCAYSGIEITDKTINWDHIIPLKKNGVNEIWNLVPSYNSYNKSKGAKEPYKWYQEQEYYDEERLEYIIYYQKVMYWNFANKDTDALVLITGEEITYEEIEEEYGVLEGAE